MSLFVINRYQGDDQEIPDTNTSSSHLSDLLRKIEERKKRRNIIPEGEKDDTEKPEQSEVSQIPRKKKRKKQNTLPVEQDDTMMDKSNGDHIVQEKSTEMIETFADQKKDFLILGTNARQKKSVVRRVLPDWLANPEIISADVNDGPLVSELESIIDAELLEILRKHGIEKLFPVQASIIPWLLSCEKERKAGLWPRDACISAPTGSGKTLAYVLPIVQDLQKRLVRKIRCLVVLPVQELAAQVYNIMKTYTAHTNLRVTLLSRAASFQQEQQNLVKKTERGEYVSRVDIVVTTPGRLIDHLQRTPGFSLSSLRFLVIDEADRATDWLQHLPPPNNNTSTLNLVNFQCSSNQPAQKLLFSATLSQDPEKLSRLGLFQPKLFTSVVVEDNDNDINLDKETGDFAGRYTSPSELTERVVECEANYKPLVLYTLLVKNSNSQGTLVFANSGETAHRLALLMKTLLSERGLGVAEISARLMPKQREEVLARFVRGDFQILVSSDALARGMDIPGVNLVISYDLPKHIKGYIHRSGRTGRAGMPGTAISLLTTPQIAAFNRMLSAAHKPIPKLETIESLEEISEAVGYQKHLDLLKETLDREQADALTSVKAAKRKPRKETK